MKYLVAILVGALLVGLALAMGVYRLFGRLFGAEVGHFFAKFLAGPAGLVVSGAAFVVYDTLWPRKRPEKLRHGE